MLSFLVLDFKSKILLNAQKKTYNYTIKWLFTKKSLTDGAELLRITMIEIVLGKGIP